MGLIGETCRVTAKIEGSRCGEVLVSVRQGTEAYFAYPADKGDTFEVGARVTIIEELPGRTVYVA